MSRLIQIQTNFSTGETDPLIRGRIDLNQYYSALQKATNVTIIPQGGVRRRPGLRYITELPDTIADDGVILVPFEFSVTDSYMFAIVAGRIYVFKNGSLITNINSSGNNYITASAITSAMLPDLNYAQSADTMIFVHQDLSPRKLVRGANDSSWTFSTVSFGFIPKYAFSSTLTSPAATLTPSAKSGTVELTASAAVFLSTDVNQYIRIKDAAGFGVARIIWVNAALTKVRVVTELPFDQATAYASGEWEIERGYEDVWSTTRGWPKSLTFHEGRLYLAGSKSRPSTIWGSRVGDFFNFDKGQSLDDESVEATVDTNQYNAIVNCISARDLQFFTIGSEFYVPQTTFEPITPTNFFVKIATRNGCKSSIKPVSIDSGTLFVQRQGKSLNEFVFTDVEAAYVTNRISLLSSHLLKNPIDMAIRRATSTDESDQLYIVNGQDGSLVCYSMMRSQQVIAPSEFTTDGQFLAVGVDVDTVYVAVKRTIQGAAKYYIERFDGTLTLDSAVTGTSGSGVTVAHLKEETVKVIADGVVLSDETADCAGVITFERPAVSTYQVGLNYDIEVKTMPVEPRLQSGTLRGFKKRIIEVTPQFFNTQSARINGQEIQFRQFDTQVLDKSVAEYTGIKKIGPLLGFDYDGVITVTQGAPLKMTLLFLEYQVSAGQ